MISRRGLLKGILAAGYAPAAIGSGVLMPVRKLAAPAVWTGFGLASVKEEGRVILFDDFSRPEQPRWPYPWVQDATSEWTISDSFKGPNPAAFRYLR